VAARQAGQVRWGLGCVGVRVVLRCRVWCSGGGGEEERALTRQNPHTNAHQPPRPNPTSHTRTYTHARAHQKVHRPHGGRAGRQALHRRDPPHLDRLLEPGGLGAGAASGAEAAGCRCDVSGGCDLDCSARTRVRQQQRCCLLHSAVRCRLSEKVGC